MPIDLKGRGNQINGIVHLTVDEVIELMQEGAVLVDIREEFETGSRQFDLEPVIFIPNSELKNYYSELPHDRFLIIADSVGLRSKEAVCFLMEHGYEHVLNLAGGIVDWERAGFSVIKDPKLMMHGQCACMLKRKHTKP
jgi:rhodanese-related sulfurtransferase